MEDKVIITKSEYRELISKAAIYDAFARKIAADKERGGYISEYEQAMFVKSVDIGEVIIALGISDEDEDVIDTIPDEEWEKIEKLAKEDSNGTEEL